MLKEGATSQPEERCAALHNRARYRIGRSDANSGKFPNTEKIARFKTFARREAAYGEPPQILQRVCAAVWGVARLIR